MLHPTPTLKESPSQTAGPYLHIGGQQLPLPLPAWLL